NRFLGRSSSTTGNVQEITPSTAASMLPEFSTSTKGLVPASGGGTTNFLRADGTWAAPPSGGGGGGTIGGSATSGQVAYGTGSNTIGSESSFSYNANTNTLTVGTIVAGNLTSGATYVPTITHLQNVQSSSAGNAMYIRVNNVVHISGSLTVDPSSA